MSTMEEIRYKLSFGSPAVVTSALTQLGQKVTKRLNVTPSDLPLKFGQVNEQQNPELHLLWRETKSPRPQVSLACSSLVVKLVREGLLDGASVLSSFLASASQIQSPQGLVSAISQLLSLVPTAARFSVSTNPHPFISLLRACPTTVWPSLLHQIQATIETDNNGIELMTPVFIFAFCNPHQMDYLAPFRQALKTALFKNIGNENSKKLALKMIEWQMYNTQATFCESLAFVLEFMDSKDLQAEDATLLCALAIQAVTLGLDPKWILARLRRYLMNPLDGTTANTLAILLSTLFTECSYTSYADITSLALTLIEGNDLVPLVVGILVSPVLLVMSFPSLLCEEMWPSGVKLMKLAVTRLETRVTTNHPKNASQVTSKYLWNSNVSTAHQLLKLIMDIETTPKAYSWLNRLSTSELTDKSLQLFPLLCGMVLTCGDTKVFRLSVGQMIRITELKLSLAPQSLAVFMYQLSVSTRNKLTEQTPDIVITILKALPHLAKDRCCVSQVLVLINSLGSRSNLGSLKLQLLFQLWSVEPRCFPYLQKALEEQPGSYLAKAKVAKQICEKEPSKHGADLLPLLSKLLNDCQSTKDTAVCTLAIDGITILCKEGIIDMKTTVSVLSPKLKRDSRPEVVASFCTLLGVAPTFKLTSDGYQEFIRETLKYLWKKCQASEPYLIRAKAFESISNFSLEDHHLKMMPKEVKTNLKLPPSMCSTPIDAARNPEDVLDYVPGDCWIKLLNTVPQEDLPQVERLLQVLLRQEVEDKLPRSAYFLGSRKEEPMNYNCLHEKSILRAIIIYLQTDTTTTQGVQNRHNSCISILNQDLNRPYPPLDWTHLRVDTRSQSNYLQVLASQSKHSRSAKMQLESILTGPLSVSLALEVSKQLKNISGVIQDSTLKTYLTNALKMWLVSAGRDLQSREVFESILKNISTFLQNPEVPDPSKEIVCSALEELNDSFPDEEVELFEIYLDVVTEMPLANLEKISNPVLMWEVNDTKLYRSLSIRSAMAGGGKTETPLYWLNDCIEVLTTRGAEVTSKSFDLFLKTLANIASRCRTKCIQSNFSWVLELMGHIRSLLRQESAPSSGTKIDGLEFLFDIFTMAVIVFSECDHLKSSPESQLYNFSGRQERLALLPLATSHLLESSEDSKWPSLGPPLAEWLLQLRSKFDDRGLELQSYWISKTLSSFKSLEKYSEASMWGKLVATF